MCIKALGEIYQEKFSNEFKTMKGRKKKKINKCKNNKENDIVGKTRIRSNNQ